MDDVYRSGGAGVDHLPKLVIGGLLAALSFSAVAQVDWSSQFIRENATRVVNATRGPVTLGPLFGSGTLNSGTGGALITAKQPLNIGGTSATLNLSRMLTPANVGKVVAKAAFRVGPTAIVGAAIDYAWNETLKRWEKEDPLSGMIWNHSGVGQPGGLCASFASQCTVEMMKDSFKLALQAQSNQITAVTVDSLEYKSGNCVTGCQFTAGWSYIHGSSGLRVIGAPQTVYAREHGDSEVVPVSEEELSDAIADDLSKPAQYSKAAGWLQAAINATTGALRDAVRDAIGELAGQPEVTGPSAVDAPTVTSTTNTGSGPQTTTTTTTHNLSYTDNSVTITTTTTHNYPDGSTTTETTEPSPTEEGGPPDQPGLCELYPDIAACAELNEADEPDIDRENLDISFEPDEGWGGNGWCPETRYVQNGQIPIPFDLVCMYMEGIRPVVVSVAWLIAGFIVLGARGGD